MPIEETDDGTLSNDKIRIVVVGAGGGGCNTIHRLHRLGIKSAETIAVNTDANHLKVVEANKRLLIGSSITRGLGAGGYPEVAQRCAEASKDKIREAIGDAQLVFLTAGMGGGTGTGAAPVIAQVARDEGAIVIGVVTYPFALEKVRTKTADRGIEELRKYADTVIVIDNNRLVHFVPNLPMQRAFEVADEITARAVKGIADTIMMPSLVNLDFADVKAIVSNAGVAVISVGDGKGSSRVDQVVNSTLEHPLLDVDYSGAKGALIHIEGGTNLTLGEATEIGERITNAFDPNANVIWGARLDPAKTDAVTVTAIMTGIKSKFMPGHQEPEKEVNYAELLEIV